MPSTPREATVGPMSRLSEQIARLREAWTNASGRGRHDEALRALEQLEQLEPKEPRWSHRAGDTLRRLGRVRDAESAYERAFERYTAAGFLAQAVALAKLITSINPKRVDLLARVQSDTLRSIRDRSLPEPSMRSFTRSVLPPPIVSVPPGGAPPALKRPAAPLAIPPQSALPTFASLTPVEDELVEKATVSVMAVALRRAPDASDDEVRFNDAYDPDGIDIDVSDFEAQPELDDTDAEAERLALMSACALFAEVPRSALAELMRAAELVELQDGDLLFSEHEPSNALFAIAHGLAHLSFAGDPEGLLLGKGELLGEGCILQGTPRSATVRARGPLTALRIPVVALRPLVENDPRVGDVLLRLLLERLVTWQLQVSPLFAPFEPSARRFIAKSFEVRRAPFGTLLTRRGRRSDGFYVLLAGRLTVVEGLHVGTHLSPGAIVGQQSLLGGQPAERTIEASTEVLLLRLPAHRFASFVNDYPPALASLRSLASQMLDDVARAL